MTMDNMFFTTNAEMPVFLSEELNPFAAMCIGRWYARCEVARKIREEILVKCKTENRDKSFHEHLDSERFFKECTKFWWGLRAINRLSIVTDGAIHFGISISNEQRHVANYIKKHLGFCPILDKEKAKELGFDT